MHCIIAYAASAQLPPSALDGLHLPRLKALLAQLHATGLDTDPVGERPSPALPHERAHARALGWDAQGALPWAAWQSGAAEPTAQAWITPCHWQVGMDQVFMMDPATLQLSDEESQALLQTMQPYLQEDGLQVRWHDALRWHAQGEMLAGWASASLERVVNANVRPWITTGLPAPLVRLHSELQMLAYNHPVNDARLARGQLPVNSFWLHGAGEPRAGTQHSAVLHSELLDAAQQGPEAWRAAWPALDAGVLAPLVQRLHSAPQTDALQLSLCSQGTAITWANAPRPWPQRLRQNLRQWLRPVDPVRAALDLLIQEATP